MSSAPGVVFQLYGDGNHFKVVVTFPNKEGEVLVFGLTDEDNAPESLCVFKAGDHPCFKKATAVNYRRKFMLPANLIPSPSVICQPAKLSAEQVVRIIEGAHHSEDIEPKTLKALPKLGNELDAFIMKIGKG
jgi:hypothetical protein